jgi:hypothetical protein
MASTRDVEEVKRTIDVSGFSYMANVDSVYDAHFSRLSSGALKHLRVGADSSKTDYEYDRTYDRALGRATAEDVWQAFDAAFAARKKKG